MNERVCLDAGVVVKLFIPEEGQDRALALLERVLNAEGELIAPAFFPAEVLSTIRRKVVRKDINSTLGEKAAREFLEFLPSVREVQTPTLYERAWALALQLDLSRVYDTVYLAATEAEGAEFWTADEKLFSKVQAWEWGRSATKLL